MDLLMKVVPVMFTFLQLRCIAARAQGSVRLFLTPILKNVRHDVIGIKNAEQFKFNGEVADLANSLPFVHWYIVRMIVLTIDLIAFI